MYYNIKIKSNGSEFSLESNNKDVTQREMDIYFAYIFNASEEFKSHIKKVEITDENVKSINDFENITEQKPSQNLEDEQSIKEKIEAMAELKAKQILEEKARIEAQKQAELEAQKRAELEAQRQAELEAQKRAELEAQRQAELEAQKQAELEAQKQAELEAQKRAKLEAQRQAELEAQKQAELEAQKRAELEAQMQAELEAQEELKKLREMVQQKTQKEINTVPTSTITFQNETNSTEKPSTQENTPTYKENFEIQETTSINIQNNSPMDFIQEEQEHNQAPEVQNEIDELINLAQKKLELNEPIKVTKDDDIIEINEENIEDLSIIPDIRLDESQIQQNFQEKINDIFNQSAQNDEIQVTTPQISEIIFEEEKPTPQVSLDEIEISLTEENTQTQPTKTADILENEYNYLPKDDIQEENESENSSQMQHSPSIIANAAATLDFKPFLAGFACSEIIDEFLICAYFIKNVLRQSDFTIKFINSKLFQATGKIANLSVLDELISKEYIRVIDTQDGKKYSITMDGEGYFAQKFQS